MAARLLDAKHKADRGDNEALRAFVNTALAKTWREEAEMANPEPLFGRHIYAVKGMDGAPDMAAPRRQEQETSGVERVDDRRRYRQGRHLFETQNKASGPGYCHFPIALSVGIFSTSLRARRFARASSVAIPCATGSSPPARETRPDRRVYALAALHARLVPWEMLLRAAPSEPPPRPPSPPSSSLPAVPIGTPRPRQVRFRFRAGRD